MHAPICIVSKVTACYFSDSEGSWILGSHSINGRSQTPAQAEIYMEEKFKLCLKSRRMNESTISVLSLHFRDIRSMRFVTTGSHNNLLTSLI